jgi:hypothetical protein
MKLVKICAVIGAALLLAFGFAGCFDEFIGEPYENQLPGVWLSSGPPEGSLNEYFVHLYWGGFDPDGDIARYQYIITDNPREGLIVSDALFDAFSNPHLGKYFFQEWEEIDNRPANMPARPPIWQGRVLLHKADAGHSKPYYCDETGAAVRPDKFGVARPIIAPVKKIWNGITMYGMHIIPNDSSFVFSADFPQDTTSSAWIQEFRRTHTFFLRALDSNNGVTPNSKIAYRTFTARTLSPIINIQIPTRTSPGNPALVPPITTFKWSGLDFIDTQNRTQDPDSVRWTLHPFVPDGFEATVAAILKLPDHKWLSVSSKRRTGWIPYNAPEDSGRFAISPTLEIGGNYAFAVQAKDEAGAVTPVFDENHNVRRILASRRSTGPSLTVFNQYIGGVAGSSISTPIVIFDLPEGIPVRFCWNATAKHYGGLVSGYRYGWDIIDLNNDDDWEVDYTPFIGSEACSPERTFFFGTHTFHVETIDNSGFKSRVGVRINIVPFSMERDLLFVDDFANSTSGIFLTRGAMPNDLEHDAFWLDLLSDVQNFAPNLDVLEVDRGSKLPITKLAQYKSIIWNVYGHHSFSGDNTPTLLHRLTRFNSPTATADAGKVEPNLLALYMAAGGHVLLVGSQPLSMSINKSYFAGASFPIILRYESAGDQDGSYGNGPIGENSFAYRDYCLEVLDVAFSNASYRREFCRVLKRFAPVDGMRTVLRVDTRDYNGYAFPETMEMNSVVTQPGFYYERDGYGTELYNPLYFTNCDTAIIRYPRHPRACIQPIFRQRTASPSSIVNNVMVAYWTSTFAGIQPKQGIPARSAVWGFEPYFFNKAKVKQALDVVLFGEWQLDATE